MSAAPNVDTYHWDTVYSATFDVVNASIKANNTFPATFSFKAPEGVDISGDWDDWALSIGGSGADVQMTCTVKSGSVSAMGLTGDLAGSTIVIQFALENVLGGPAVDDPTAKPGSGKASRLMTKLTAAGPVPAISVISEACTFPKLDPSTFGLILDALPGVFGKYFNANVDAFQHVFHVMMINEEADHDGFTWIKPSASSYAVAAPAEGATTANSVFGVLALVDGGKIGPLQEQSVDIAALVGLPKGANSAFAISAPKVTKHLLLNGAIATIQGSKASDFQINDSGLNIINVNKLVWGNFKTSGGVISPTIDPGDFLMRVDGDHVLLEITNAHFETSPGVTLHMNLTQRFGFNTVKRKDGKYVFIPDVKSFGNPNLTTNVSVSKGMQIAEIVIGCVGIVAALAGGASALTSALTDAADTAVTSATDAVITISEDAAEDAVSSLSEEELSEVNEEAASSADSGVADADNPDVVQQGSFLKSSQFRIFCGIAAGVAGAVSGGMALAGPLTNLDYDKIPAFDDFAANVLGASQWPETKDYELLGATFRNSLVCGIKLT